ncbi:4-hydroxy-tetrahydrodipicolinate synthase [Methanocella sp. CWC-04]|uniref:4-hydroxy-tetrahydrodipicolinate synthase n=1 Tax=Methanooceanicella nereidis TaxID=2052831 RepID=A0AAP2W6Y8_9EURY|nr:4-hydroxy-tetrahydrodipicolinate synthase [Methanocella sp. CWC-04]MCD1294581.1 4-hydroxy-tetrahydrodipicolinate synthase [Methanocella sp. CWC-04]
MNFKGVYPALITPFKKNGEIDEEGFRSNIDFVIKGGVTGIVPCGCTGEAATLNFNEQKRLLEIAVDQANGRVPVIGGSGSNNTREAVDLTKFALEAGADGAMLITPYYNKPGDAGQLLHYKTIAEKVDIPIILYNVPSRTGVNMKPKIIAELAKVDNIVGIKEASGSLPQVAEIIELTRDYKRHFTVLSGDDNLTIPIMSLGGEGVVSVAANILPKEVSDMIKYQAEGNTRKALDLYYRLAPIMRGIFIETNPIPVKAAANMLGLAAGELRPPLTTLAPENQKVLEGMLTALGKLPVKKAAKPKAAPKAKPAAKPKAVKAKPKSKAKAKK